MTAGRPSRRPKPGFSFGFRRTLEPQDGSKAVSEKSLREAKGKARPSPTASSDAPVSLARIIHKRVQAEEVVVWRGRLRRDFRLGAHSPLSPRQ